MGWSEDYRDGYNKQLNPTLDVHQDSATDRGAFIAGEWQAWHDTQKQNAASASALFPSSSNAVPATGGFNYPVSGTGVGAVGGGGIIAAGFAVLLVIGGLFALFGGGGEGTKRDVIEIPSNIAHSIVFYPNNGQLAVSANNRYFVLYGIEALKTSGQDFARSPGFIDLDERISRYHASIECSKLAGESYKCFLVTADKQRERYDISKYAINLGAAKATRDAPDDYKALATKAQHAAKGNWRGA